MKRFLATLLVSILLSGSLLAAPQKKPTAPQPRSVEEIETLHEEALELFDQGQYPQAKAKVKQAYASFGLLREKDPDSRALYLRLLCDVSVELHDLRNTLAYAKELSTHAVNPSDRAFAFASVGRAHYNDGQYEEAIGHYQQGLAIELKTLGPEHPDVAITYLDVGGAYSGRGDQRKAIWYYQKSLAIDLKTLEPDDPDLAYTYSSLGSAHDLNRDFDKAIGYYDKALAIELKALGPSHLNLAYTYSNLGSAHALKGDHAKAAALFQKALAIASKKFGSKHPFTKELKKNLAKAKTGANR